jgi:hypothetical protein
MQVKAPEDCGYWRSPRALPTRGNKGTGEELWERVTWLVLSGTYRARANATCQGVGVWGPEGAEWE